MKTTVTRPDQPQKADKYRGFIIHVVSIFGKGCQFILEGHTGLYTPMNLKYEANSEFSIQGFTQRLDNYLNKFELNITEIECDQIRKVTELASTRQNQGQPFL